MPRPPRIRVIVEVETDVTPAPDLAHRDAAKYVLGLEHSYQWRTLSVETFDVARLQKIVWDPDTGERRSDWPLPGKPCLTHPAVDCDAGCQGDHCELDDIVNAELAERSQRPWPDAIFLCGRRDVRP